MRSFVPGNLRGTIRHAYSLLQLNSRHNEFDGDERSGGVRPDSVARLLGQIAQERSRIKETATCIGCKIGNDPDHHDGGR
jgi:hypothetical protein